MKRSFVKKYESIRSKYLAGQYSGALAELVKLSREKLEPMELWQLYEAYGMCYYALGEIRQAAAYTWQAVTHCCGPALSIQRQLFSNYLMQLHYLPEMKEDHVLAEKHFMTEQLYGQVGRYTHARSAKKRKLRIGYLSPDFNGHIVVNFAIQLLACYDKERYEVICYSLAGTDTEVTGQVRELVDVWQNLAQYAPEGAAEKIYLDQVDILFDLAGHTVGGKTLMIMAYKPAPVQISGIGWFDTTGLRAIDYFLTDVYCDPEGNEDLFSETLLRLPHSHFCYTPSEAVLQVKRQYTVHAPVVFGSFNNFQKITEEMLSVWLCIVQQVPGSHLLLKNVKDNAYEMEALRKKAEHAGFLPQQIEIRTCSRDYLEEYLDMDIALDTYPYPGGGTTCEALYMGIPVISLYGTRHGARFGYSILKNLGLEELAVKDTATYIERAVALARDPELLLALHSNLRSMMQKSPLMDAKNYVAEVEAYYEKIWEKYLQGQSIG